MFFFQAEDGIRDRNVTGVQTCALPIYLLFFQQATRNFAVVIDLTSMTNFTGEKEQLCLTRRFDIPRQNACASYQNQWCAPAQSKESPRGNSTGEFVRPYRLERLGKIIARL